jgi:hypothetical protein
MAARGGRPKGDSNQSTPIHEGFVRLRSQTIELPLEMGIYCNWSINGLQCILLLLIVYNT